MSTDIYTMNLSESSDGMVPIDMGNRSNAFVPEAQSNTYAPEIKEEKNIHDYKDDMDSTPISDVLGGPQEGTSLEPPLMAVDPRAVQVAQANAMMPQVQAATQKTEDPTKKKNPFDPYRRSIRDSHCCLRHGCRRKQTHSRKAREYGSQVFKCSG